MKRVGLFGGSFDPVHCGHLLVARAAWEELGLDRLFFIPASQSPFKPNTVPAPPETRLQLLRLGLAGQPGYEIDVQEIQRGGLSYAIETVRSYAVRWPDVELFYLIGADHLDALPRWREAEALARLVEFVVVPRPGAVAPLLGEPYRCRVLQGFPLALSSSQVRDRIKAGMPIDLLTPPAVAEAIANNRLYF